MMSRTLGAPFGGTTRAGQYGFDCAALVSILPPNFCGGGGICSPLIDIVELGEPGVPYICCASAWLVANTATTMAPTNTVLRILVSSLDPDLRPALGEQCPRHVAPARRSSAPLLTARGPPLPTRAASTSP